MTAEIDLLHHEIADPDTQWSLGTFGAIAEFSRDHDEQVQLTRSADGVSAVTTRGGIAIRCVPTCRPVASESISKAGWNQRIALCLPDADSRMGGRTVLTEIGADHAALRAEDRAAVLFDLGLGAPHADFCVRIADPALIAELRNCAGHSIFAMDNPAMGQILRADPHRVFISRLGRIEVYQPIPPAGGRSPDGPHTHVLPKLLASGRTHPATEPIPEGWRPCAHVYPPHPARNGQGEPQPFVTTRHDRFQDLLALWADPESVALKRRVADAVNARESPSALAPDRHGRASIRIALRQLKAQGHASATLTAWLAEFDQANLHDGSDEAGLGHG